MTTRVTEGRIARVVVTHRGVVAIIIPQTRTEVRVLRDQRDPILDQKETVMMVTRGVPIPGPSYSAVAAHISMV